MRIGAISDIHGNKPAFEAVMADMPDVDRVICAGDVVGYNPWPSECIREVKRRDIPTVQGNHDRAVASETAFRFNELARAGVEFARDRLDGEEREWLGDLPIETTVADGRVRIVHGHPDDPDRYTFPGDFSPRMLDGEALLVLGHTHIQHHEVYDEGLVVNPGSVGQPRDRDPRAAYAIVDLEEETVEERRVDYDVEAVCRRIDAVGLPSTIGDRLRRGE